MNHGSMNHGSLNCPCCHVTLGQEQFARGTPEPLHDEHDVLIDVRRIIYVYCPRCGGFELLFSVTEAKVIGVTPAARPCDDNRILSKLPHRPRAPIGTPTSRTVYAPVEVPA